MSATIINKMLVRAVYDNDVSRVRELILMGADPNYSYRRKGQSCNLLKACIQNKLVDVLKVLLENGVYINPSIKSDLTIELRHSENELISFLESIESHQFRGVDLN